MTRRGRRRRPAATTGPQRPARNDRPATTGPQRPAERAGRVSRQRSRSASFAHNGCACVTQSMRAPPCARNVTAGSYDRRHVSGLSAGDQLGVGPVAQRCGRPGGLAATATAAGAGGVRGLPWPSPRGLPALLSLWPARRECAALARRRGRPDLLRDQGRQARQRPVDVQVRPAGPGSRPDCGGGTGDFGRRCRTGRPGGAALVAARIPSGSLRLYMADGRRRRTHPPGCGAEHPRPGWTASTASANGTRSCPAMGAARAARLTGAARSRRP